MFSCCEARSKRPADGSGGPRGLTIGSNRRGALWPGDGELPAEDGLTDRDAASPAGGTNRLPSPGPPRLLDADDGRGKF